MLFAVCAAIYEWNDKQGRRRMMEVIQVLCSSSSSKQMPRNPNEIIMQSVRNFNVPSRQHESQQQQH